MKRLAIKAKLLLGLGLISSLLIHGCGSVDSDLSQDNDSETLVMGMEESRELWGRSGGLNDDFRNRMESQIKEVIMYGFDNPLAMTLRDTEGMDGPLVEIETINISRGQTKTKEFKGNVILAKGSSTFTVTDYDIDFSVRLQMPNGVTDLVNFTMSDLMHQVERAEITGAVQLPTSTVFAGLGLPSFILGVFSEVSPEISGTRIIENHQPTEINKGDDGISIFQKGIYAKVLYPLCCTVSNNACPELEKIHPLLAERKKALTARGYTFHGLAPENLSCSPSGSFSSAIDDTLSEIEKNREWSKGSTPSTAREESIGFFDRLWLWFGGTL